MKLVERVCGGAGPRARRLARCHRRADALRRPAGAAASMPTFDRRARRAPAVGHHPARPPRRAGADAARRQDRAPPAWVPLAATCRPRCCRPSCSARTGASTSTAASTGRAVARSAWANAWNTRTRGASTLTMQLAGLIDDGLARPAGGRSVAQKIGQALTATQLERAVEEEPDPRGLPQLPCRSAASWWASARCRRRCSASTRAGWTRTRPRIAAALVRAPERASRHGWRSAPAACCRQQQLDCAAVDAMTATALVRRGRHAAGRTAGAALRARRRWCTTGGPPAAAQHAGRGPAAPGHRGPARASWPSCSGRNVEDGAVVVLDNASGEVLAWVGSSGGLSAARRRSTACSRGASPAPRSSPSSTSWPSSSG